MRYAIISDLHANLQATEAVLADLAAQKADRVICLGDAIGYGPQPAEVLSLVHAHVQEMLMGNHEAAAAGLMDTRDFSRGALTSLVSTRRKLNRAALDYIAALPYEIESPAFRCSHSDFVDPRAFGYVETAEDAARSFAACEEPLLFVGHTHEPAVFVLLPDGATAQLPVADFTLELGHRYLVNPGSVGMPRTDDPRATYCIYDTQTSLLSFHRTSYSVREFRRRLEADAQDGEQLAYVRGLLDDHALPEVHARADFAAPRKNAPAPPARRVARTGRPRTPPPAAPPPRRSRAPLVVGSSLLLLALGGGLFWWTNAPPARKGSGVAAATALDAAAAESAGDVRVVLDGRADEVPITLVSRSRGATAALSSSQDLITRTCLATLTLRATNTAWQQGEWVVRPEKKGRIELRLEARGVVNGRLASILYDDLAIDGVPLPAGDFETGDETRKAWGLNAAAGKATLVMDKNLARGGDTCLRAGARAPAVGSIEVSAKQELKLTFWYRLPPAAAP